MAQLIEIATRIQDLYWQNYTPNDKFLDIDDFKFQVAIAYSAIINAMYKQERAGNKAESGFNNIEIPASWLLEEDLTIKCDGDRQVATTSRPVFSFDWDNAANALQGVHSIGTHCVYRKISLNERRFRGIIPPIGVVLFYLNSKKEIVFWGAKSDAKIKIQYVPEVTGKENDCLLSDNIVSAIVDKALDTLFKARSGTFVQKANDENPNIVPQQQIDPLLNRQ